jgi:hypothetical protein
VINLNQNCSFLDEIFLSKNQNLVTEFSFFFTPKKKIHQKNGGKKKAASQKESVGNMSL